MTEWYMIPVTKINNFLGSKSSNIVSDYIPRAAKPREDVVENLMITESVAFLEGMASTHFVK